MTAPATRTVLAPQEVASYLLRRGLTSPASIVDGDFQIVDTSRRNCNMVVATENGPSYLLKQGLDEQSAATVAHEAHIYRGFAALPAAAPLARFLPRCHGYDRQTGVLALELLPDAMSLREHAQKRRRCSPRLARALGTALAALHACDPAGMRAAGEDFLRPQLPWALSIYRPSLETLRKTSGAGIHLFKVVQRFPALRAELEELRHTWQPTAVIHGDARWENCLVHARRDGDVRDRSDFKLIDWEFASLGEPGWDIGSVFAEYLTLWLRSVPITGEAPADRVLALSTFPLPRIQPAIRAFWAAYVKQARLTPPAVGRLAERSVRFCGARLFQLAYENVSGASDLNAYAAAVLQLGQNILERPAEASLHVLGLPIYQRIAR